MKCHSLVSGIIAELQHLKILLVNRREILKKKIKMIKIFVIYKEFYQLISRITVFKNYSHNLRGFQVVLL